MKCTCGKADKKGKKGYAKGGLVSKEKETPKAVKTGGGYGRGKK